MTGKNIYLLFYNPNYTTSSTHSPSLRTEPNQGALCVLNTCRTEKQTESQVVLHGDKKRYWEDMVRYQELGETG